MLVSGGGGGEKINAIINQRPLRQKCNLNNIFHEGKGHFATGKRALIKTWAGLGPPGPSGSYATAGGVSFPTN